jgi:hypothetical protein
MKRLKNKIKRFLYGKIKDVGVNRGIGYNRIDEYYIDEHTYLFGFRLKTVRYWKFEDYVNKTHNIEKRTIGFKMKKGD